MDEKKINPRFLRLAERQKRDSFLEEEALKEERRIKEENALEAYNRRIRIIKRNRERSFQSESVRNISQVLERDENGKPILNLTSIEKTTVSTPTQRSYDELMRVYECGGWKWSSGFFPRELNLWTTYEGETGITAGICYPRNIKGGFQHGDISSGDLTENFEYITLQEFYNAQNPPISKAGLDEINEWFEQNDK